jgi:hypothetical protein
MASGNPKGTNRGGGPRKNACVYHPRPDGTVWVERKKHCKQVGWKHHTGYMIFNHGSRGQMSVHRYIAEAFIPNPDNKEQVDHINRVRHDNRVENLRWATRKENGENKIWGGSEKNAIDFLLTLGYTITKEN